MKLQVTLGRGITSWWTWGWFLRKKENPISKIILIVFFQQTLGLNEKIHENEIKGEWRLGADSHLGKDVREGHFQSQDGRGVRRSHENCSVRQITLENKKTRDSFEKVNLSSGSKEEEREKKEKRCTYTKHKDELYFKNWRSCRNKGVMRIVPLFWIGG